MMARVRCIMEKTLTSNISRSTGSVVSWNMADRKSTRLNSSHDQISYAVFCLKKKKNENINRNLAMGKPVSHTIRDGAHQIAVPALAATHVICTGARPMFLVRDGASNRLVPRA